MPGLAATMMTATLALLLAGGWQATATIELHGTIPGACAIRYQDDDHALSVALEKRDAGTVVTTALAVTGAGVRRARLVTANVDTAEVLAPVPPRGDEAWRAEGPLEERDSGALLMHDLAISGGRVEIDRGHGLETFELPHPLPREVVAQYLNCTGDLVIPY